MADALALPEELTLPKASASLARLLAAISAEVPGAAVCVQAQSLRVFDSSALAVLLECRRAALASGRTFAVAGLPVALRGLAQLYGVDGLLAEAEVSSLPAG